VEQKQSPKFADRHAKNVSQNLDAQVAELVDALDSKSSFFGSAGSIPALGT
jgi:hypothetical protein